MVIKIDQVVAHCLMFKLIVMETMILQMISLVIIVLN